MNTQDVMLRILAQRQRRFPSTVPGLNSTGVAPCRLDGRRLRVAFARAAPGRARELVARVLAYCAARSYGLQWSVMPAREGEQELAPALLAQGVRQDEGQRLMARGGRLAAASNPQVRVTPITSWQSMVEYETGSRRAFFDDPHPLSAVVERRAQERMLEQGRGWCRYFAAELNGVPVGGCYYTQYEDVPTIMGVYTIPAAQRHGVATTLLTTIVDELVAQGNDTYCLYVRHGNPAENLYRTLGFVPLLDEYTFVGDPD